MSPANERQPRTFDHEEWARILTTSKRVYLDDFNVIQWHGAVPSHEPGFEQHRTTCPRLPSSSCRWRVVGGHSYLISFPI